MFRKDINLNDRQEMINFLTNHFRYNTMNPWNRMTSYANNVKLYNLDIPQELSSKAYDFIGAECTAYNFDIHDLICDFTADTGYSAGFNGRSDGYIVMYDTERNKDGKLHAVSHGIDEYEDFEDWSTRSIAERVKLVQRFDELCDDIRNTFVRYLENAEIKNIEVIRKEIKRIAVLPEEGDT